MFNTNIEQIDTNWINRYGKVKLLLSKKLKLKMRVLLNFPTAPLHWYCTTKAAAAALHNRSLTTSEITMILSLLPYIIHLCQCYKLPIFTSLMRCCGALEKRREKEIEAVKPTLTLYFDITVIHQHCDKNHGKLTSPSQVGVTVEESA